MQELCCLRRDYLQPECPFIFWLRTEVFNEISSISTDSEQFLLRPLYKISMIQEKSREESPLSDRVVLSCSSF